MSKLSTKGLLDSTVAKLSKAVKLDKHEAAAAQPRAKPAYYQPLNYYGTLEQWLAKCEQRRLTVKRVTPPHIVDPHYHAFKNGKPVAHYNTFLHAGFFA